MIRIISPGFHSSIQDNGRFGYRHLGIPCSGCMDLFSYRLANSILNNSPNCSVIETTFFGPTIEFLTSHFIAITGSQSHIKLNKKPVSINQVIQAKKGDILTIGKAFNGIRNYLAISGGFSSDLILNSQSYYQNITKHSALVNNQLVFVNKSTRKIINRTSIKFNDQHFNPTYLNVYEGPEFNHLSLKHKEFFFCKKFSISSQSNRMAYILNHTLPLKAKEIITSSVQAGTVQLTPSGKLIVLMRDAQTTGGYSRVLHLSEHSISQLSQQKIHSKIRFKLKKSPIK